MELSLLSEVSIVSSQPELLETLYLPLSKEGGQPRINCCLILAAAEDAVCLHSWGERARVGGRATKENGIEEEEEEEEEEGEEEKKLVLPLWISSFFLA